MSRLTLMPGLFLFVFATGVSAQEDGDFDPAGLTTEVLAYHATQYGNTPGKRSRKESARKELFTRGPDTLRYLMEHVHVENVGLRVLADNLVTYLGDDAAPVLVEYLESPEPKTRKFAAWFLGYLFAPQYAEKVRPLLDDEEAVGAAMRTLGKWGIDDALPEIIPFLKDEQERRRVVAVNALRDIGNPAALPYLEAATRDRVFTVRKAAERAIRVLEGASGTP